METDWSADRRLDVLILGPMGSDDPLGTASNVPLRDALDVLLTEDEFRDLLNQANVIEYAVTIPDGQNMAEIVDNVLRLIDTADLVVFNITPKPEQPDRANVFYELGLVQALGIPTLLVVDQAASIPFYATTSRHIQVPDFEQSTLIDRLRAPFREFLSQRADSGAFTNDRVSQFYLHMPIVDISAAVGLATGYYHNFLSRLLSEGGFLSAYADQIETVVYVRPSSLRTTYEADKRRLKRRLAERGLTLDTSQFPEIQSDPKGPLWCDRVGPVVVDIPRAIYPLRSSPRMQAYIQRNQNMGRGESEQVFRQRFRQMGIGLLARVERTLRFLMLRDAPRVDSSELTFTTFENAPGVIERLSGR